MSHILKDGERWCFQKDGRVLRLDKDEIVQDGQVVRVPLIMQDSRTRGDATLNAEHQRPRPGFMNQADSVPVVCAHAKMIERTQNAWRDGAATVPAQPVQRPQPAAPSPTPVTNDESPAYRAYKRRLEDGYRRAQSSRVVV